MPERHELPAGTNTSLRERFEKLSPEDQVRVLARLDASRAARHAFDIPRRNERSAPLTFAQEGLWFLQQIAPENAALNQCRSWRIDGPLDLTVLERALTEIVRRHEILRTRYTAVGGEVTQEVMPTEPIRVEVATATTAPELRRRLATQPFDLTSPLMVRAGVAALGSDRHELTIARHHIACDGWSSDLFRRELSILYDDFSHGRAASLPELKLQFTDYALWAAAQAQTPAASSALADAMRDLEDLVDPPSLMPNLKRPLGTSGRGGRVRRTLPAAVVRALRAHAREHGATLFMALVAVFSALVHRLTGRTDVLFVTPTAGRTHPSIEPLIGMFANQIPVRTDVAGDPSFTQLLMRVRDSATRAFERQEVPFQRLQSALRPGRARSRSVLAPLVFSLQNTPRVPLNLPGLHVEDIDSSPDMFSEDAGLFARERDDGALELRLDYRADLFDEESIERALSQFVAIAEQVTAAPDRRLSEASLPTLSPEDRRRLSAWNSTAEHYPRDLCVSDLFEQQAALHPDEVAVEYGQVRLSYGVLNQRANQLAHYLRTLGAGPDVCVGLYLNRSADLLIALLAILKSDAAYVPLDPAYPAERIQFMLDECSAPLLVTSAALADGRTGYQGRFVRVDADRTSVSAMPADNPGRLGTPEHLAYVMFTSGSTGRPKGVAMPHRALVNLICWHQRHTRLREPARTLQFAPVSFDVSFQDIVATWCTGGTVMMVDEITRRDPAALLRRIRDERIARVYVPFVALQSVARAHLVSREHLPHLSDIISAGETLQITSEIRQLMTDAPACCLHNHYGPTEAHVVASHVFTGDAASWPPVAPIGRPLANVRMHVLDEQRNLLPVGTPGELYVGGDCLARGYLHRHELTTERFVRDPFDDGGRLYWTGDRARWTSEGTLEFLGRIDRQIKIRGHRVEPDEVEAVLAACPGIRHAAVLAREDRPGETRLVGYFVTDVPGALSIATVQAHLRQRLPEYMVPAILIELEAFPRTPSGKVDREAFPAVQANRSTLVMQDDAPASAIETTLAAIWADVLGLDRVGVHESFFELGGHSLLAASMLLKVEEAIGQTASLGALFEGPTIRQLAHALRDVAESTARLVLTRIHDASPSQDQGRPPLVVMPSLFGFVVEWRRLFEDVEFDRPVYGLELVGAGSYWKADPSLEDIAAACAEILRRDLPGQRVHLAGYSFGGRLAYEVGQQLDAAGQPPQSVLIMDTTAGATRRGPWWRDVRAMAGNAPAWLINELSVYGPRDLGRRIRTRWRFRVRARDRPLAQMFDLSRFSTAYRRRLTEAHRAFAEYRIRATRNKVIYLYSRVRPLIHRDRPDGGWGGYVQANLFTRVPLPSDHGSIFSVRWRPQVLAALRQAADKADDA